MRSRGEFAKRSVSEVKRGKLCERATAYKFDHRGSQLVMMLELALDNLDVFFEVFELGLLREVTQTERHVRRFPILDSHPIVRRSSSWSVRVEGRRRIRHPRMSTLAALDASDVFSTFRLTEIESSFNLVPPVLDIADSSGEGFPGQTR